MSLAPKKRGWQNGDPPNSERPRGKARSQRKSGRDMGLTPTELHRKSQLMRQFLKRDGSQGNSDAYRASPLWCGHPGCHRMNGTHVHIDAPNAVEAR